MFEIQDAPDKAKRIFVQLIDAFEEQNINPTPLNYFVWYQYLKGDQPKFRQAFDAILNDPFGYNDRVGKRLYDEYLTKEDSSQSEFDRAFRRLVDLMVKKMDLWSNRLEAHSKELDACTSSLSDPNLNAEDVKRITRSVRNTAESMQASTLAFQEEMLSTSDEVKQLRQQLIEALADSMKDELTEIGNRKAFNNALAELMFDAQSAPQKLCLILSDIDHFKKFNDNYGHLVGDSVLRYYASIMKKTKQDNETICRYGGEEFAIIVADTTLELAEQRADQIRMAIAAAHLKRKNANEPLNTITASFGVAHFHGASDTAESFIARADAALYQAKNNGRNQVVTETQLPATIA